MLLLFLRGRSDASNDSLKYLRGDPPRDTLGDPPGDSLGDPLTDPNGVAPMGSLGAFPTAESHDRILDSLWVDSGSILHRFWSILNRPWTIWTPVFGVT